MISSILTALMMVCLSNCHEVTPPDGVTSWLTTEYTSSINFVTDGSDTLALVSGTSPQDGIEFVTVYTEDGWKAISGVNWEGDDTIQLMETEPVSYKGVAVTVLGLSSEF